MNKYILIVVSLLATGICYAQNVSIRLQGESLKGKNVRLSYIDDRVSFTEKPIDTRKLDDEQTQTVFRFSVEGIKEAVLRVNARELRFCVVEGTNYTLNVLPYTDTITSFLPHELLPVDFSMEKDDKVNMPVEDVFSQLSSYLSENERMLQIKDSSAKVGLEKLQNELKEKYHDNEYLVNYIDYEFTAVRYALHLSSGKRIKYEYFKNKPILYDNVGYMDCFDAVFNHYFSQGYRYVSRKDIENWLDMGNYNAFNDALGRDSVLQNEVFRELVFLSGMKDAFLDGYFSRTRILSMLKDFALVTKFEKHKQIAENLIQYLKTRDFYGSVVNTNAEVRDIEGNLRHLSDYMDKPLLLCFVKLDNIASLKELETVHFCHDSIRNNCNVLVICFDNNFEKMYNFVKQNKVGKKYKFDFVHFDNNWDFAQQYGLHFFPHFVLVDKNGCIVKNPMNAPSQGGLKTLFNKKQN